MVNALTLIQYLFKWFAVDLNVQWIGIAPFPFCSHIVKWILSRHVFATLLVPHCLLACLFDNAFCSLFPSWLYAVQWSRNLIHVDFNVKFNLFSFFLYIYKTKIFERIESNLKCLVRLLLYMWFACQISYWDCLINNSNMPIKYHIK